jgi:hypothetical protein
MFCKALIVLLVVGAHYVVVHKVRRVIVGFHLVC